MQRYFYLFCSAELSGLSNFNRGHHEEHICEIIWTFGSDGDISYLELWWPFCSAEWNHLGNFSTEHHEEHFCECHLKEFLSRALVAVMLEGPEPLHNFGRWHYGKLHFRFGPVV